MKLILNSRTVSENQYALDNMINNTLFMLDRSDKNYLQKKSEIFDVGKFLMLINKGYEIIEVREQPDFIIKSPDKMIGLEHEICIDSNYKKVEGSFADLVISAETKFRKRYPAINLLVIINVNINKKLIKKEESKNVENLFLIIENFIIHDKLKENDLVHSISIQTHSCLTFKCITGAWWQQKLHKKTLTELINRKESKRLKYIANTGLNEQWLLIVIGSLNQSSFDIDDNFDDNFLIKSGFDRIFVLEYFRARLFEL
jgi:hypothetical protein